VIRCLLETLPAAGNGLDFVGLVTAEGADVLSGLDLGIRAHEVGPPRGFAWELSGAAESARAAGADLLFTTRELVGRRDPPTVLHLFEPPAYRLRRARISKGSAKDAVLTALLGRSLRRAAAVTAGSATTAGWVESHYDIQPRVILPGIEARFFTESPVTHDRAPYFLLLATGDPRDDHEIVLEAMARVRADVRLVVAGSRSSDVAALPSARDVRAGVDAVGWVSDDGLIELYRGALAFVHTPRYEAYAGLPALEAMAAGTPVVAIRAPGVTEALDGAASLVARRDAQLVAVALEALAGDHGLRESIGAAGRARVEPLRWERAAAELVEVFKDALG
jgi:glycosyltransferase involved in cell wall biosynthesis